MPYMTILPVEEIENLPLPELALTLLARLARGNGPINVNSTLRGVQQSLGEMEDVRRIKIQERIADAWAWLQAHALIGPHAEQDPASGWQRVTEMGREVAADPKAVARVWAADRLSGDLDPRLASARSNFALGEYEVASFAALKAVEVAVREAAGLPDSVIGTKLMHHAFNPDSGPLTDSDSEGGEKQAITQLFAGAIGAFKNPASHRTVQFDDPVEVAEIVQLADLLLRIVARAETRNAG